VEVPRSLVDEEMQEKVKEMPEEHRPHTPVGADLKWRYFWRIGPRPSDTRFQVHFLFLHTTILFRFYFTNSEFHFATYVHFIGS
jgi:hypothetical protein